ncbi:fasciculation and elongation protein zeta-2 [Hippocampus zosterae]|uniref:fasciculation and elongation protein zeta-2 n=1 Tax=Hippocampus zosterae TaxID=109293 RepID=UPI00223D3289|nr:fasciculation and elongation protein zeta-2 [Hippocampus zosterae]
MEAPTVRLDDGCPNLCADRPPKGTLATAETHVLDAVDGNGDEEGSRDSQGEFGATTSTEDPVDDSSGILSLCFEDWSSTAGNSDEVTVIAEDKFLQGDEIWNALTKSHGQLTEMDRKQSRTRSLHMPAFNPEENVSQTSDIAADVSEVEELREQLDMHAIIVPCLGEEPLFTAEQVIEEIEEMMQDSSDSVAEHNPSQPDLSMRSLNVQRPGRSPSYEERVRRLNVAELNERVEETESAVTRLSEELVQHLALRDELDFEKEVKNTFISALIDVQNRQKEHREALKKNNKKKHQQFQGATGKSHGHATKSLRSRFSMEGLSWVLQNSFRQTFGSRCSERQYLTTVIPYEKKGRPPSIEDLQTLIKILHAIRDDSDMVPALLTDYILKVLCPT